MANPEERSALQRTEEDGSGGSVWPVPRQLVEGNQKGPMAIAQYALYQSSMTVFSVFPKFMLNGFAKCFAQVGKRLDRGHARAARILLRQALNEHQGQGLSDAEIERRVTRAYEHLFHVAIDAQRFDRRFGAECSSEQLLEHVEVDLSPAARAVLGKGCVVVSGHCGDWEMAARIVTAVGYSPLYVISKPPRNYPLSVEFQRLRESWGMRLLPRRGAMQFASKVVQGGGTLGMLLDQRARTRPVMAPFFGRNARCDRSAGVLLRRLRCPVVFVAAYKTPKDLRWRFRAHDVLLPDDVAGKSAEEICTAVNQKLEAMILEESDQYFWLHDRYRGAQAEAGLA